jgi:FkbM family methyltransferase
VELINRPLRTLLSGFTHAFPVRGRHRLADGWGARLAPPGTTLLRMNGVGIELDHHVLQHRMMFYGLYEEHMVNYLKRHVRPGQVIFDPGANVGYFAAQCLGLVGDTGHVHSFEPSPTANAHIRRSNDLSAWHNWSLWDMALSDKEGTLDFYDTPRVMTKGFACLEGTYDPVDKIPHPVQVTTIDAFCAQRGIDHIDFLKLDIEGSELPAIRGAQRMMAAGAISTIMVETTLMAHTQELTRTIDTLLRAAGYTSFRVLRDGSLAPLDVMSFTTLREDVIWRLRP